jgi:hypothetical protein
VVTSFFRRASGKSIHDSTYAGAVVFFIHDVIADPTVTGRAIDYIDGEKVYANCASRRS